MNQHFQHFNENKEKVKDKMKIESSEVTLSFYNMITEMLEKDGYESSHSYLLLVANFIEENEYITPKQQEIVGRIYRHPKYD